MRLKVPAFSKPANAAQAVHAAMAVEVAISDLDRRIDWVMGVFLGAVDRRVEVRRRDRRVARSPAVSGKAPETGGRYEAPAIAPFRSRIDRISARQRSRSEPVKIAQGRSRSMTRQAFTRVGSAGWVAGRAVDGTVYDQAPVRASGQRDANRASACRDHEIRPGMSCSWRSRER